MAFITIAVRKGHPNLYNKLEDKLSLFIKLTQESQGDWQLIKAAFKNAKSQEDHEQALKARLTEIIEDYILIELQEIFIQGMIRQHYFYFSRQERDKVFYYSKLRNSNASQQVRQQLRQKLHDYLLHNRHLNIQGFVYFRLQCYVAELRKIVESSVDDYLIEKEYQEFIKLLKYFVEIQEPKVVEAHILLDKSGGFQIRDGKRQLMEQDYEQINAAYLKDQVDSEDLLVSALVTTAPGRVVVHRQVDAQYPKLTATLKKIFDSKITLCKNCQECMTSARLTYHTDK